MIPGGAVSFNSGNFKFQITTTGNGQSFTLPIAGGGATYKQNFVVNWGDGNKSNITAYNSNAVHTYATAGTYTIEMNGICQWFCFANAGSKTLVKQLVSFAGDIGFKVLNFYGCTNLNTLVSFGTLRSLITATNLFNGCTSLTTIPSGIFAGCPAVTDFSYSFSACNNVGFTSLPADLFRYNTLVTNLSYAFYGSIYISSLPSGLIGSVADVNTSAIFQSCPLTSIDPDVFRYFTGAVTGLAGIFGSQSGLTSIPTGLFQYNTLATSFSATFSNCSTLATIPTGLFDHNTLVTTFDHTFVSCRITAIPADLFKYNTAVTSFNSTFNQCQQLTTIPAHLFDNNTQVTTFYGIFQSCFYMNIPTDLFKYNTLVQDFGYAFFNVKMATLPAGIFQYNTAVTSFYYAFANCTSLTSLPVDVFRYNTLVTNFQSTFAYDTAFHTIPAGFLGCTSNPSFSGIFTNVTITSITAGAFKYATGITNAFSSLFSNMTGITSLPAGLFDFNTAVTSFSSMFSGCSGLTTVPADLFRLNVNCLSFTYTFSYCIALKIISNLFYEAGEQTTRFLNQAVNFTNCFNRVSFTGTQGTAPDLWNCSFGTATPVTTHCFGGAGNSLTSLTNYASIPTAWE